MKLSEEYVRVTDGCYGLGKKRNAKASRFSLASAQRKFGRMPSSVGCDDQLSDRDKVVYWCLSLYERAGQVTTGIRCMASACCVRPASFCKSLRALERRGHINVTRSSNGKRSSYVLLSPVFEGRRRMASVESNYQRLTKEAKLDGVENETVVQRRRVTSKLMPCLNCRKLCKPSKLTGYCRKCMADTNVRRIAREEVMRGREIDAILGRKESA